MYTDKVMEHFANPKNVGSIENADGIGEIGNPVCGDMMTFYIKVKDNILEDVKFKTFGCGAAIAVSSMVSEMAKGKTIEEAMKINNKMVATELGGLPANKMHCSNLGADALHKAIENYLEKVNKTVQKPAVKLEENDNDEKKECACPFCKKDIDKQLSVCRSCNIKMCPDCFKVLDKDAVKCPKCGKEVA